MTTDAPRWLTEAVSRLDRADLWPNFHPLDTPFALYDGVQTWLVTGAEVEVVPGLHPEVRASTAAEVGGVLRANVWGDASWPATDWAAVMAHEAFHVVQQRVYPHWPANEAAALTDPPDAPAALAWRHTETRALVRGDAPAALACRAARAHLLPPDVLAYERDLERFEGLAYHIEWRVRGRPAPLSKTDLPPDQVRRRAYHTGAAWARLLDRHRPGWAADVGDAHLDLLLARTMPAGTIRAPSAADLARAGQAIRRSQVERAGLRAAVLDAPFILTFEAAAPLWPRAFDPMNLRPLGGGEVWHGRHLHLANHLADIELLGAVGLTGSAGRPPLLSGVGRLTVALEEPPMQEHFGTHLALRAPGLRAHLPPELNPAPPNVRPAGTAWRVMLG